MRYFIKPDNDVLTWCLSQDAEPHTVPFMPTQAEQGLVVAHLIGGEVFAEVVLSRDHLVEVCGGPGFPLGRMYFQIPKSALYMVCSELTPAAFGES
jgi:hypothetical protein